MSYDKETWRASVDNGKIPDRLLAEISPVQFDIDLNGPARMHPEAAAAMSQLLQKAHADGIVELRVKYSYRTIAKQWEKWANYQAGGNLAAYPGTSNHGWAVAVDFTGLTARALTWLKGNARRYGFLNDVSSENWHHTYQGGYDAPEHSEDDMNLEKYSEGWEEFEKRLKAGKHPTEAPKTWALWKRRGWNAARFASAWPK